MFISITCIVVLFVNVQNCFGENELASIFDINSLFGNGTKESLVSSLLVKANLDPMRLPDISDFFSLQGLLPVTVYMNITNGYMSGFSNISKLENFDPKFENFAVGSSGVVHIDELNGNFTYSASASGLYDSQGILRMKMKNVTANLNLAFKIDKLQIHEFSCKITNYTRLEVVVDSEDGPRFFETIIANSMLPFFKHKVLQTIEAEGIKWTEEVSATKDQGFIENAISSITKFFS